MKPSNPSGYITVPKLSWNTIVRALCLVSAVLSAVFVFTAEYYLPLSALIGVGGIIGLFLPIVLGISVYLFFALFEERLKKARVIFCSVCALASGIKYTVNFLCCMGSQGISGIDSVFMNAAVALAAHLIYAALVLALSLAIAKPLSRVVLPQINKGTI